ncbi:MAG: transposase [Candidatus Scalindua sp.]
MASHDSLPPHTHGSVPCRWLAVTRAGLSSLLILALLGALMSRPLRIQYPGAWYHVMNRGRRREVIFPVKEDYLDFIKVLKETVSLWNIKIAAYCLMLNHYHFLLQTPEGQNRDSDYFLL